MNMTVLLKKCTYGLLLITSVIGCFCSAETGNLTKGVEQTRGNQDYYITQNASFSVSQGTTIFFHNSSSYDAVVCLSNASSTLNGAYADGGFTVSAGNGKHFCFYIPLSDVGFYGYVNGGDFDVNITLVSSPMSSSDCQSEYNLIPINSVDTNYCVSNNLCPSSGTGSCEEGEGNRSALYINDIQHPGSALINITIPEEIQRNYTEDEEEMNINVEGYGYDQEKMQELVNTQYYTPTPEDMGNLVSKIADFLPLLAIMLLVIRTWYLIKKVF